MNGYVHFDLAPPRSWDHFEELCADTFQEEWQDATLVRHGRAGQAQHGVDIVGRIGAVWPVGLQCKKKTRWPVKEVTTSELDEEVEKAKNFNPPLQAFYLISTAPDDQPLQEHARIITDRHKQQGLFSVSVLGWGELVRRATRHNNVAAKHFGPFSTGPATPLLATWRAANAKLLMNDDELAISIKELIHDLIDYPAGRIILRQQETEDLLFQITNRQAAETDTLADRIAVVELRDKLKILRDRERAVAAGLQLLLGHKDMRDYVRIVWEKDAPLLIRSFVEQELDPDGSNVTGLEKIRIHPPGTQPEDSIAVFMPGSEIAAIFQHQTDLKKRYPTINADIISELPSNAQFAYAIPRVLHRVIWNLSEGISLKSMEEKEWLDMSSWKVTT
ncbi:hypothetical protein [Methylobacterium sp. 13MFTsu3.1M2]|uniref:hypothetical protein n=1 Tax=Methylobacterium sp. 13MFTsu3.1M2 TaxID=1502776 RepID=UPI0008E15A70|nr:hypothetical protein [Methylobacterium sp. 13MFTsu3.1M2]SFF23918.1 hypothetical protein SAMN02799627_05794 [Methylobacterium sp. 13MFTsu3.1M2]